MALRCIHCNRSAHKVTLDANFQCVDKLECWNTQEAKSKPVKHVNIFLDCACQYGDVTHLGIGVYTTINKVHSPEYSGFKYIGTGTVPIGEFTALIYALNVALLMQATGERYQFKFFSDAQAIVRMFHGEYKTAGKFKPFYNKATLLRQKLGASFIWLTWIVRDQNKEADKLSKQALEHLK